MERNDPFPRVERECLCSRLPMGIVLASGSQSRRPALDIFGLTDELCGSAIDEKAIRYADPVALTKKLAEAKARKVVEKVQNAIPESGDAVVAKNGRIFEKPRGRGSGRMLSTAETSEIRFRDLGGRRNPRLCQQISRDELCERFRRRRCAALCGVGLGQLQLYHRNTSEPASRLSERARA